MVTTFTNLTKSASTYVSDYMTGVLSYLLTSNSDHILVGSGSDEYLIWQEDITWTNGTKN